MARRSDQLNYDNCTLEELERTKRCTRSYRDPKISKQEFSKHFSPLLDSAEPMSVVKLHGYLKQDLKYELSYSTVLRYVHRAGYRLKVPGKIHPEQDEEAREVFINKLKALYRKKNVEIWFGDEVGIEGDPRPSRSWYKKGTKPKVPYDGKHLR